MSIDVSPHHILVVILPATFSAAFSVLPRFSAARSLNRFGRSMRRIVRESEGRSKIFRGRLKFDDVGSSDLEVAAIRERSEEGDRWCSKELDEWIDADSAAKLLNTGRKWRTKGLTDRGGVAIRTSCRVIRRWC